MLNDMKRNILSMLSLVAILFTSSCSDMMDIDNSHIAYDNENRLDNANDSIYSVVGILAQLRQIADRTVIAGELRGDLMTVSQQYASTDLRSINSFEATESNKYAGRRDFYSVINNCNYAISRMDTSITEGINKVMVPEYAQLKTLRAYTYWQMALMFGSVNYFTDPLISIDDSGVRFEKIGIDELAAKLITELEPVSDARPLDYGTVDGRNTSEMFYPAKMLLGDLYLYTNSYEKAAQAYYDLISARNLTVSQSYANYWQTAARTGLNSNHPTAYANDVVTRVMFDSQLRAYHSQLGKLTYSETPSLLPVDAFVSEMAMRTHFHTDNGQGISRYFNGDTRGCAEFANGQMLPDAFGPAIVGTSSKRMLITKFYNNLSGSVADELEQRPLTSLALIHPSSVYLRYAEAINRLGRPTVAFAVLKYGLSRGVLADTLCVDSNEVKNLPAYINFKETRFDNNIGTAARGCGLGIKLDRAQYIIPAGVDTTDYVERAILQEMAAETCFGGQRFFDLLRMSRHRPQHPLFMAEIVSRKYDNADDMLAKLKDINAWFMK